MMMMMMKIMTRGCGREYFELRWRKKQEDGERYVLSFVTLKLYLR
jgi:hypothetical protein